MKVSEIFYSIQGEGINAGKPAVFLRLALCNLKCGWCDTKYTWDWRQYSYDTEVKPMSVDQVLNEIIRFDCNHLVITGGEPLLQQDDLVKLAGELKAANFYIEIETNGTILPQTDLTEQIDQWNVSPKLENSGNPAAEREIPSAYLFFSGLKNSYFKFVMESEEDLTEIQSLARKYRIRKEKMILMPQASTKDELHRRSARLIEICKETGYRFGPRLQVQLWGAARGR